MGRMHLSPGGVISDTTIRTASKLVSIRAAFQPSAAISDQGDPAGAYLSCAACSKRL